MVVKCNLTDILLDAATKSSITLPNLKENQIKINFNTADEIITQFIGNEPLLPFAASDVFQANITDGRRLTAVDDGCKAVYEVTFDITGSNFQFRPGDTIGILPHNRKNEVDAIIDHLNLTSQADLQYSLSVDSGKIPSHIPSKSTVRHVLTYCCEIRSVLKKLFLLALSRHTKDESERKILEYLCSKEGASAYTTHILNKYFCILDLFATFKSCQPPLEVLLSNLPRLLPRPYSIANSSSLNINVIKICFSVTQLAKNRKGLVTGWLERNINSLTSVEEKLEKLNINNDHSMNSQVPIYIRKNVSGFVLPEDSEIPLILVGPGTGVSPFIGFLEERQYLKCNQHEEKFGEVWMFFGCRNPKLDFIYECELNRFLENGIINRLSTSFSRIESNSENKYIQNAIIQNGEDLVKLINNGAAIFVCGDLKNIAAQVKESFVQCIVTHNSKSVQDAVKFLADMEARKRYLVDAWS